MSYAHTKRRKLIAKLKRKHPRDWKARFETATVKFLDHRQGPPLGTLQDVFDGKDIFANPPPKREYISVADFAFPKGGV